MQWAVRNTPNQRASGSAPSNSSTPSGPWNCAYQYFLAKRNFFFYIQNFVNVCNHFCIWNFLSTASSTGLIYIDPTNLRRSSAISSSAAAAAAALEASNSSSYLTSASSLARAYSIVIRQISDLMSLIPKYNHLVYSQYPAAVKLTYNDAVNLQVINIISFMNLE